MIQSSEPQGQQYSATVYVYTLLGAKYRQHSGGIVQFIQYLYYEYRHKHSSWTTKKNRDIGSMRTSSQLQWLVSGKLFFG